MSLANIRSLVEVAVNDAFAALTPAVPVVFQNVQEEPPGQEYVILNLVYPNLTQPILCPTESNIETINGTVTLVCYVPRAEGMKRLEELAVVGVKTLNSLKAVGSFTGVRFYLGAVEGPITVLDGDNPLALASVTAPFNARVTEPDELLKRLQELEQNHDQNSGHDSGSFSNQRNVTGIIETFEKRLEALEANHDADKGHNSGEY